MKFRLYHRKPRRPTTPPEGTKVTALIPFFFEKSQPAAQSQSGFFRLPREIRDQIYHLLFDRIRNQYREGNVHFDVIYGPYTGDWRASRLRPWLLICKRMLSEALEQFYRKAQCLGYTGDQWWAKPSPFRLVSLYRIRKIIVDTPDRGIEMVFGAYFPDKAAEGKASVIPNLNSSTAVRPGLKPLHKHLASREHAVKELKLNIMLPRSYTLDVPESVSEWGANLSLFEALGTTFERVEFCICPPSCERTSLQKLQHLVTIYGVLQYELERVGRKMIGISDKDEEGWSVRSWVQDEMRGWHIEILKTPEEKVKRNVLADGLQCWQDNNTLQWYRRVPNDD